MTEIVSALTRQLELRYGTGLAEQIVVALVRQLSWTRFLALM